MGNYRFANPIRQFLCWLFLRHGSATGVDLVSPGNVRLTLWRYDHCGTTGVVWL